MCEMGECLWDLFWLPNVATGDYFALVNKIKRHIYMGLS